MLLPGGRGLLWGSAARSHGGGAQAEEEEREDVEHAEIGRDGAVVLVTVT